MSDPETPDEVIETDDGILEETDAVDDEEEPESDDEDAGTVAEGDEFEDEEPEDGELGDDELGDDELADRAENEAQLADEAEPADDDGSQPAAGSSRPPGGDELVSRLRLIGQQPLSERASALRQLHDELRDQLESGDPSRR